MFRRFVVFIGAAIVTTGAALFILCAPPLSPLEDPANFKVTVTTPQHPDSVYYIGDTLRLVIRTNSNTSGRSLAVTINSLNQTFLDTSIALRSGRDTIAVTCVITAIVDLRVAATAYLSDNSRKEVSFVIHVTGRAPRIISQSDTAIVCTLGVRGSLYVNATGTPPLRYQWYKGDAASTGDTLPSLVLGRAQFSDSGVYYCVVNNGWNPADTSEEIRLSVRDTVRPTINHAPRFLTQPFTMTIARGTAGKSAVPIVAEDTIDKDLIYCSIDTSASILPSQSLISFDTANFLLITIHADAMPGTNYKATIVADDRNGGKDTLTISVAVYDSAANDTIGPTIAPDLINLPSGSISSMDVIALRFYISDNNGIHRVVCIDTARPFDTTVASVVSTGLYSVALRLYHGINVFHLIAFDNATKRNRRIFPYTLIYNKKPQISLVQPLNGSTGLAIPINLLWQGDDSDAQDLPLLRYAVYLGKSDSALKLFADDTSGTSLRVSSLKYNTTYQWKVVVRDGADSAASNTSTFTTFVPSAKLISIQIGNGVGLSPMFMSDVRSYAATIPYEADSIIIIPVAEDTLAKIQINGIRVRSGAPYTAKILDIGANSISVNVLGRDSNSTLVYDITVTRSHALTFQRYFGSTENDYGTSVAQTTDTGYAVAGSIGGNLARLIKLTKSGELLWSQQYGRPSPYGLGVGLKETEQGHFVVLANWTDADILKPRPWLFECDNAGNILWQKTYICPGYDYALPRFLATSKGGGYCIASEAKIDTSQNAGIWLMKTTAAGVQEWDSVYRTGNGYHDIVSIYTTSDSGYIVGGIAAAMPATPVWVFKVNKNGQQQWSKNYSGTISALCMPLSEEIYIWGGNTISKYSASGSMLMQKVYPGTMNYLQPTDDGNIVGAGWTDSRGAGSQDGWLALFNSNCDTVWTRTYGSPGVDQFKSVQQTKDGGFAVAGYLYNSGMWLVKTDREGLQ